MSSPPQDSPSRFNQVTTMGQRYLSRWVSWSGTTGNSPPCSPGGTPRGISPGEGHSVSPQPPRAFHTRTRTSSKGSNMSDKTPNHYPLVPKLPVPPLGATLSWYLSHMKTVLDPENFEELFKIVEDFGKPGGIGERIQEELIRRHDEKNNWAYQYWLDDMYMSVPLSLPVNSNPGMVFPFQHFQDTDQMVHFASKFVVAIFDLKEKIDFHEIDVDRCAARERHQPLCMEQYGRVFTSYRRPGIPRDKQISTVELLKDTQHIVVCYKNNLYRVEVIQDGARLTVDQVSEQLAHVLREVDNYEGPDPPAVGIMTADNRRTWGQNRQILSGEPTNQQNLSIIETAILILCFDEPLPAKFNLATRTSHRASLNKRLNSFTVAGSNHVIPTRDEVNAGHQMIHGGGSIHNTANRWFDKTVQLIFTKDGWCGLCYEHSVAEGIVVIQLIEQILQQVCTPCEIPEDEGFPSPPIFAPTPSLLQWSISPVIARRIQEASDNVDKLVSDLDYRVLRYIGYGRNLIKKGRCSPDAFIQVAMQLAFFRSHGHLTSTYESASTRRFRQGRVDCIRANTPEVLSWCESMVLNAPLADRLIKFDRAILTQTEIMVNNILGRGIDIHLLGLREMAKEMDIPTPEIFAHSSYQIANRFRLSTSQVPTLSDSWMGYGPVVPDGYGASYNPHGETIVFCLSAWNCSEKTSTLEFGKNLERAFDEMKTLLEARSK